ncbi:MAG TPA: hypothetical protein VGJ15_11300 [Pirellulales bacterium]|jgi:hypothetical protein
MRKSTLQELIDSLPSDGDVNVDALIAKIDLLEKLEESERQVAAGQVVPHEEVVAFLSSQ